MSTREPGTHGGRKATRNTALVEQRILTVRGQRVMVDADLAVVYQVSTSALNQQVKRNRGRFPSDFMFQLTTEEYDALQNSSQTVMSSRKHRGRRYRPYVFTEHGAVMLASVLNSEGAVQASVQVVRAFVRLREMLSSHHEMGRRLDELERRYEGRFSVVFQAIRQLMGPERRPTRRRIGFRGGAL
jgi:hypothetical protein